MVDYNENKEKRERKECRESFSMMMCREISKPLKSTPSFLQTLAFVFLKRKREGKYVLANLK